MSDQRYAAFLRGVSPMNLKMPKLKSCLEEEGLTEVATLLSSGNVVFTARSASETALQRRLELAMGKRLGKSFLCFVRSVDFLEKLVESDPFLALRPPAGAKRVVTFLREPPKKKPRLPLTLHDATILAVRGSEVFSAYKPGPKGPVFMTLLERTFGEAITTRTWDTVRKVTTKGMHEAVR